MWRLELTDDEIKSIKSLITEVAAEHMTVEDADFLHNACLYAHELPRRIRSFLNDFRLKEPSPGVCIISGYPVNFSAIGPTPTHWKWKSDSRSTMREQILLTLHGSLLGDLLGWATQQDGHLVHDVLPIKEHENDQLGTGSQQMLWWHTEDAFHDYQADYIGLHCIRNPDNTATIIGTVDIENLEAAQIDILFQPRFSIRPDESHQEKNESDLRKAARRSYNQDLINAAYEKIKSMNESPEKISVFFGSPDAPYLRLDPYFMTPLDNDPIAQHALNDLIKLIDESLTDLVLQAGDICFIDNYRAVHGRRPFKARYDGTDRWLKRVNIARDLRKSRGLRVSNLSRVIS
jgi:Fe(II)/alpha-ketoglutarate-dependent arginine beta-hydroxylase